MEHQPPEITPPIYTELAGHQRTEDWAGQLMVAELLFLAAFVMLAAFSSFCYLLGAASECIQHSVRRAPREAIKLLEIQHPQMSLSLSKKQSG